MTPIALPLCRSPRWRCPPGRRTFSEPPFFAETRREDKSCRPWPSGSRKTPIVGASAAAGQYGGDIVTLVPRARDIRYISTYAYTRLVGYDRNLELQPDLLEKLENEDDRVFTFTLRAGHRWSDGQPFTAEDFRYYWEDVAQQQGSVARRRRRSSCWSDGKPPRFEVLDERTVRYTWDKPNPRFLPQLAGAIDPGIYRASAITSSSSTPSTPTRRRSRRRRKKQKLKSWAALHNRLDDMKEQTNPDLPTLMPWRVTNAAPANRFVFERNPYYHRVDTQGQQLPYVDRIIMDVSAGGLFAAKANAGEADLLFRGLSMGDIPDPEGGREGARATRPCSGPMRAARSSRSIPTSTPRIRSGASSTATCASAAPCRSASTARP